MTFSVKNNNDVMSVLSAGNKCTGCGVCVDVCACQAISLKEDINGFYYPSVDADRCVSCDKCDKTCHAVHSENIKRNEIGKAYAFWSLEEDIILNSASGGVFAQIAKEFLQKSDNGVVVGAYLAPDNKTYHIEIQSEQDIIKLQNSKYQHSIATGIYTTVKKRLSEGRSVLFSGTPCMVAALYHFLQSNGSALDKLYTIEILCHGIPTSELLKIGLAIEQADHICKYRTKSEGWLKGNRTVYEKAGVKYEKKNRRTDFLFRSYLTMSYLRPSCYDCQYARINRVADITAGDYWGLNRQKYLNHNGVSLMIVNSEKGRRLVNDTSNIHVAPTSWRECLPYNQNLFMATNNNFFNGWKHVAAIRKLPLSLRVFIYQNGFTNKYLQLVYHWLTRPVCFFRFLGKNRKRKQLCKSVLSQIERDGGE